jgi:hypothetical protein
MIDGGGFTASEVSFRLACMKVLGTLQDRFAVKSWRMLDESDLSGNRYVQAAMSLAIGESHLVTSARRGRGPGRCADQGDASGAGEVVSRAGADAAGHLQRDRARRDRSTTPPRMCGVTVSFHADWA